MWKHFWREQHCQGFKGVRVGGGKLDSYFWLGNVMICHLSHVKNASIF